MSWLLRLLKVCQRRGGPDGLTFFLINNQLQFFYQMHADWLQNNYGVNPDFANRIRYSFPRGRCAVANPDGRGFRAFIEMSGEIEPFVRRILSEIDPEYKSLVEWDIGRTHYRVTAPQETAEILVRLEAATPGFLGQNEMGFMMRNLPEVYVLVVDLKRQFIGESE